jgi:hypothetical protein
VLTPITASEGIDALWHAHQDVIGGPCPVAWLEIAAAHCSFETDEFRAMHGYNFGNLRGKGNAGSQSIHGANEIIDGHVVTGPDVDAGFAAYTDRFEGARAYCRFLGTATHPGTPNRYQAAWDAACRGDIPVFCEELNRHGYFTADISVYTRGVESKFAKLLAGPMPDFLAHLSPAPTGGGQS